MPATPTYALPYPAQTDPANVPVDMQELADRTEVVLASQASSLAPTQPVGHYVGAAGEPAFASGWAAFDGGGSTWSRPRFYRDQHGLVIISGLIAGGALGTMFVLPAGYRPIEIGAGGQLLFVVASDNTGAAQIAVAANGAVQLNSYVAGGSNSYVSLDGIVIQATKP